MRACKGGQPVKGSLSTTFRQGQPEFSSTGELWQSAQDTCLRVISPTGMKLGFYNELYCLRAVGCMARHGGLWWSENVPKEMQELAV